MKRQTAEKPNMEQVTFFRICLAAAVQLLQSFISDSVNVKDSVNVYGRGKPWAKRLGIYIYMKGDQDRCGSCPSDK